MGRDSPKDDVPLKPRTRNKGLSRFYFFVISFFFLVVFLDSVISLGTFGAKHTDIRKSVSSSSKNCILFSEFYESSDGVNEITLSSIGPCAVVLWGQVSVVIVSAVWLVYSIVLTIIGASVISLMRILDLLVIVPTFLLSLCVSITIHAGLTKTCNAVVRKGTQHQCSRATLITHPDGDTGVHFYDVLEVAQNSSWVSTILFLMLTIWAVILMVVYCHRKKHRKWVEREALYGTMPSSSSSSSSESDCDNDNRARDKTRKDNPFTNT